MKKTLATLIKLQKAHVDDQRRQLNKLQDILEGIERGIAALEIEKAREQVAAENNPEARATYGAFLKRITARGHEMEKERRAVARAVDEAHARLSELFEEQKRYEIAEEHRIAEEGREERRLERIELDEIGGVTHERRRGEGSEDH
jgi:flagellar biosynthesis chaperone FliJ